MSSPALAENTNAAPAAAEPVVAAKKAKTSVEGKASPTKVVEAPAEEPKRKESGEGAVAEKPAEPAAEPAKEVPVPRRQRFAPRHRAFAVAAVDRFTHRPSPPSLPRSPRPPSPPRSPPRRSRPRPRRPRREHTARAQDRAARHRYSGGPSPREPKKYRPKTQHYLQSLRDERVA